MKTLALSLVLLTFLAACPAPTPKTIPGGKAAGMVIGADFDGTPLTVGKGELEGKPVVITYFATW